VPNPQPSWGTPLLGGEQIQQRNPELAQNLVGQLVGQPAGAFQHVVDVGLRQPRQTGQPALRDLAALQAGPEVIEQPVMKVLEVHSRPYFP